MEVLKASPTAFESLCVFPEVMLYFKCSDSSVLLLLVFFPLGLV